MRKRHLGLIISALFLTLTGCAGEHPSLGDEIAPEGDGVQSAALHRQSRFFSVLSRIFDRICTTRSGEYNCNCQRWWNPDQIDCSGSGGVNECAEGLDDCDENATCTNTVDAYTCDCNDGYAGDGVSCADVDECAEGLDDCDENATCTNTDGDFDCTCNDGYSGSGTSCTADPPAPTDECALGMDNCDANATCTDTATAFLCTCNDGYSGDGTTCTADPPTPVDECALGTDNCSANASCADTATAFVCTCNGGYGGDGVTCTDVNECAEGLDDCDANATCTNTVGDFACACNDGYSGDGTTCTQDPPAPVDECALGTDNCSANATCTDTATAFLCTCNGGYTGNGVTCTDVDECAAGTDSCPEGALCSNTAGSFACTCPDGTGDGTACGCDLTGTFALLTELDIEWDPVSVGNFVVVQGGSDTTFSWAIRRFDQDGNTIESEQIACGGTAPDFCSPVLNQAYAQYVPDTLWELPTVQHAFATIELPGVPQPNGAFVGPMEAALSGLTIPDPLGAWPASRTSAEITWIDEDVDGQDGVTSFMRLGGTSSRCNGLTYAGLPIPATAAPAAEIYTGSRSIAQLSGTIDGTCDTISGSLLGPDNGMPKIDGRIAGCEHVDGTPCTVAETDSLDAEGSSAGQRILGARFTMVRVADAISCAQVRALTFP